MPAALYTIGYEGRTMAEFLDDLCRADVQRVVDVRELPLSRKRGFSKTALEKALAEAGIEYVHMKPLGNPRENRERYWSGDVEAGAEVFSRHLQNGSRAALEELADVLVEGVTCLLCFERDHAICHRDVIVDALRDLQPDVNVEHL